MKFAKVLGLRLLTWALVIWIGVSFIFFIPRMFPSDPVEAMIAQMTAKSGTMDPEAKEALRSSLRRQFGLEGTIWEQYTYYLQHGLFQFDFVSWVFGGQTAVLSRIVYALVGIAGLWSISLLFRNREPVKDAD